MLRCNSAIAMLLLSGAAFVASAQTAPGAAAPAASGQTPSLTVDRDPARSPDGAGPAPPLNEVRKEGGGYVIRQDVEEVILNATVLDGNRLVQDLQKDNFTVFEDGVKQNIITF